ncbi:MAG: hypothetical protein R6T98_00510 [Desulfatiglandales bacterium]
MKNLAIFTIPKKMMDFFELTDGRVLKRPAREPRPPARRAYAPEGTAKKPIVFRSRGVIQRSHINYEKGFLIISFSHSEKTLTPYPTAKILFLCYHMH